MNTPTYMKKLLFAILIIGAGKISGAATNEFRSVASFPGESHLVPAEIGSLQISYVPNSRLERLRVRMPELGAPMIEPGRFEYIAQTEPLAAAPIRAVTVAQILNANPFRSQLLPTARKWLERCVNDAGIYDLALAQGQPTEPAAGQTASEASFLINTESAAVLLRAAAENNRNLATACQHLPLPANDAQRRRLAVLFGELPLLQRETLLEFEDYTDQGGRFCSLQ